MNELILVAEDDPAILAGVADLLRLEGYEVAEARDGERALELYGDIAPDLVLLDVMMPKTSGYDVCRRIRSADAVTPILMLTAKGAEIDKVVGLELGADDYIVKPFGVAELLARVRSALRRASAGIAGEGDGRGIKSVVIGESRVDFERMTVTGGGGTEVPLTPKEAELLMYFAHNEGRAVSREELLELVWGVERGSDITTRSVDQHILRIRQKLEPDPSNPAYFHTVHGIGYRFEGKNRR